MAPLAKIVSAVAEVDCNVAAEHAFPVYVFGAMLFTGFLTCSESLQLAVFAQQVFFRGRLLDILLYLAIDHTSEVWLGAFITLVEGAGMHGESFHVPIVLTIRASESLILIKFLLGSHPECPSFNLLPEGIQLTQLSFKGVALNVLLAAWALHESERDSDSAPLM